LSGSKTIPEIGETRIATSGSTIQHVELRRTYSVTTMKLVHRDLEAANTLSLDQLKQLHAAVGETIEECEQWERENQ